MNTLGTLLINGFIALMLFILWAWDLPARSLLNRLVVKLRRPILWCGLWHGWQMFAPDPIIDNCRLQFEIRLADGSIVFVEPNYLRFPDARRRGHYRWTEIKIALVQENGDPLRASMCKYVAAQFWAQFIDEATRAAKCPVEVRLVRFRQRIPPLEATGAESGAPYKRRTIYTQAITLALPPAISAQNDDGARLRLCAAGGVLALNHSGYRLAGRQHLSNASGGNDDGRGND